MSSFMQLARRFWTYTLFPTAVVIGCGGTSSEDEGPPAHVENPTTEVELTTIHLTQRAVERIGIEVGTVEERAITRRRQLGGELMVQPGSGALVTAPSAATVLAPLDGDPPTAGSYVTRGQPLMRLVVLPGGGDLGRVQEEATAAEARVENARSKARRAAELLREGVGSEAEHEDAQTELASAEAAWNAARARLELLQTGTISADAADLSPITLQAPESGFVHGVTFAVGQTVAAGAQLMEIAKHDPLWVRVPVYVGFVANVDRAAPATVVLPGDAPGTPGREASPIEGPPTADPTTASADLFFRMGNADNRFRPGERVSVSIALQSEAEQLSVPWAAVLHDVYGGTWVYESLGEHAYARRRVEVLDVVEGMAILVRGPSPGTPVVVVGAAELYSTEFGISH